MHSFVRLLSPALVGSLFASVLIAMPSAAVEPPSEPVTIATDSTPAGERPDAVAAMVTAQAQGVPVEDLSQRTESTQTFANPDGTWTTEMATGPERVQQDDGSWTDIDTTLVQNAAGEWVPRAVAADVSFSDGGSEAFATMAPTDDSSFGLTWPEALPEPVVTGSALTYPGVVPNGDLVVQALPGGFSHEIVLHQAPTAPVDYQIPLQLDGLELVEQANGALSVRTDTGKEVASAPTPLMWDHEDGPAGEPETVAPLTTTVDGAGADARLVLTPDMDVLTDPATQFPVTLDPTFSKTPFRDVWVQNADYTNGQVGSPELRAGTYDGGGHKARSFVDFDTNNLDGKHILSATLKARNFYSGSCANGAIRANAVSDTWNKDTLTWANQPGVYTGNYDDYANAYGYTGCPEAGWAQWNVIDMVRNWTNGTWTNRGIRLKAVDETSNATWRKYRSANYTTTTSFRPQLEVTYNSYPSKATKPQVTPGNTGYAITKTPTLKTTVSDPDGGKLRAKFVLSDSAGTPVWTGFSCSAPPWTATEKCTNNGGTASVTVPATANLNENSTYTVMALAQDASGAWSQIDSPVTTFKIDTVSPTVTISASGFTNNTWKATAPASNTFTLTGSPDTSSFEVLKDSESTTVTANSSGVGKLPWDVDAGWHTLSVIPHDHAGNPRTATAPFKFSFGVNKPAFSTPESGASSVGVFRLEPVAQSGASSMTLKWRHLGQGAAWNPATTVTTTSGSTWTGATDDSGQVSTPGALMWNAAQQIDPNTGKPLLAPRVLQLQACFTYPSPTPTACSTPLLVELDDGFGPQYPVTALGPASVALTNGALMLPTTDTGTGAVALGRVWSTNQAAGTATGPFGRGWQTAVLGGGASETTVEGHRDGNSDFVDFVVSYATGGDETFIQEAGSTTYTPVDSTNTYTTLDLDTGVTPTTLKLSENTDTPTPTVTTWHLDAASDAWVLDTVNSPGTEADVATSSAAGQMTWISQVPAGSAASCTATTQAEGCRGLLLDYTAGRITSVTQKVHATGSTTTDSLLTATYEYTNGMLTRSCTVDPDGTSGPDAPLCESYEYDTAGDVPRLVSIAAPGQTSWRFNYDSSGRVTGVERALTSGTGVASWTIDYNLPLGAAGLPNMSAASVAEWGQDTIPTKVYAVHEPGADGGASTDPAQLFYTQADGVVTNTATYGTTGWLVETNWTDQFDNVVQSLDGPSWARVQEAPASDRPALARSASSFTDYSADGRRVEEEYGPTTTATLKDGTTAPFRSHTTYTYDDEAPSLGGPRPTDDNGPFDLVVEETHAASAPDMSATDYDTTTTRYEYDPVVVGDGNGWELGVPTRVKTQEGAGWSTEITRYTAGGLMVESRQPGGATDTSGAGSDAHSMKYIYYSNGPNAEDTQCGDKPGWVGLLCMTVPAGQPTGPTIPVTWYKSYTDELKPAVVVETSGTSPETTTTRTTSTTYDALERPVRVEKVVTGGDSADPTLPATTITYNQQGEQETVSSGGKSVTTRYDSWGREVEYIDAVGNRSVTTYNPAGAVATVGDGAGTYTYDYSPRGVLTGVDAGSGVGVFTYDYTAAGEVDTVTYPNGIVADYDYTEVGIPTSLTYSQGTSTLLAFSATVDVSGRTVARTSPASAQQFTFDSQGRLTLVEDVRDIGCTTRTYGYDESSNRKTYASYGPTTNCQQSTPTVSKNYTYDSAGRTTNSGYTYDRLGRARVIPASDTSEGAVGDLSATYFPNDMVASLSQTVSDDSGGIDAMTTAYDLDPSERIKGVTTTVDGAEASRLQYVYSNASDSPSAVKTSTNGGADWTVTRYLTLPGLGMAASTTAGATVLHLANPQGDLVATMANTPGANAIDAYSEADEFGNPITGDDPSAQRYGWLGARQRSTDALGGLMLMGSRVYNPGTGMFQTQDAVWKGNITRYTYPQDPLNEMDLDGLDRRRAYFWGGWKTYDVVGPNYTRIWMNKSTLLRLARFSSVAARMARVGSLVATGIAVLAAAGIITSAGTVAGSVVAFILDLASELHRWAARTMRRWARRNTCPAFRLIHVKGVIIGGYPYLSSYGCGVGGKGPQWPG